MLPQLDADPSEAMLAAWQGTVTAELPNKWRVMYRTLDPSLFDMPAEAAGIDEDEVNGFILDEGKLTVLEMMPDGVPVATLQSDHSARLNSEPYIGLFLNMSMMHAWEAQGRSYEGWTVNALENGLIELSGKPGDRDVPTWTLDPGKGFAMIKSIGRFNPPAQYSQYAARSETHFNRVEAVPGIWITESGVRDQVMNGVSNVKCEFRLLPGTLEVNRPLPGGVFEPALEDGTRIVDRLTKRSYMIGGRSAQERRLQKLGQATPISTTRTEDGAALPTPGGISATSSVWSQQVWKVVFAVCAVGLATIGVIVWRRRGVGA